MKIDDFRIAGTSEDRRIKLTKEQKAAIAKEREENGTSYNKLAQIYGVSRQTIMFACNPKKYKEVKEMRATYHRINPTSTSVATERQRKVRERKKKLIESISNLQMN